MQKFNSFIIRLEGDCTPSVCSKCKKNKLPTEYYIHSVRKDGAIRHRPICKDCRIKGGRKNWPRPKHSMLIINGEQICKLCNINKKLHEFYAKGCFADGTQKYQTRCKTCVLELSKQKHLINYPSKSEKRSASPKNFLSNIHNKASKRKQHLGFDIDLMFLLKIYEDQKGLCALSGVEMTYIAGRGRIDTNISLDRIDSSRGYLRDNVQLVCTVVNRMKQDLSQAELVVWCKHILRTTNDKI